MMVSSDRLKLTDVLLYREVDDARRKVGGRRTRR
jgi:hypothetical protein